MDDAEPCRVAGIRSPPHADGLADAAKDMGPGAGQAARKRDDRRPVEELDPAGTDADADGSAPLIEPGRRREKTDDIVEMSGDMVGDIDEADVVVIEIAKLRGHRSHRFLPVRCGRMAAGEDFRHPCLQSPDPGPA